MKIKVLVVVGLLFLALESSFGKSVPGSQKSRSKRFIDICSTDEDCGVDRCCINYLKICAPKRGLEQSCNFKQYHGCGCKTGLFCQVAKCLGTMKYYRCLPPA